MKTETRTTARNWWTALALAVVAFAYFSVFRSYGLNLPDEGTLLHKFERLADGERLYADFHGGYTPGVFQVHAALQGWLGESILPGRVVLGIVNALSVAMLYLIAVPLAGVACAAVGALLYAAFIPVHPGYFAAFNIPYPTWYNVAIFLGGILVARRFVDVPSSRRALGVGLLAGLGFYFKPNFGAFQLAAGMLVVLAAVPRRGPLLLVAAWWLTLVGVLGGAVAVFGGVPGRLELEVFFAAMLGAAWLAIKRAGRQRPASQSSETLRPIVLVGGGFLAVTLAWLGAYSTSVPFDTLMKEALFIGSDYASFFYVPHPDVALRALALAVGFLVVYRLPRVVTFAALAIAFVAAVVVLDSRPMLHGFVASVMSEIETSWSFAAALAAMWLVLGIALGSSNERDRSGALTSLAIGAPFLYAGNYPRTDYMHWVWSAPLAVLAGTLLASLLARAWSEGLGRSARALVTLVVLSPLVLLGALRVETGLHALLRIDESGMLVYRKSVELTSHRAPLWINIGRAQSYRDLDAVVATLRSLTEPGEKVFTFPALDVVSYLADRPTPLRDSYFFPRWIGRDDELDALRTLEAAPPRFVVVLHDEWTFFEDAASYYTALGDFVTREYRPYVELGQYAILAHRSVTAPPPQGVRIQRGARDQRLEDYLEEQILLCHETGSRLSHVADLRYDYIEGYYPVLVDLLAGDNVAMSAAAVSALRNANDERVGAALSKAAAGAALPERERQLALRLAGAWAPKPRAYWFAEPTDEP